MKKYSQEEKAKIVKSAFVDDPQAERLFVTDNGTVLTQQQYDALSAEQRKEKNPLTFTNPNTGKTEKADSETEMEEALKESVEVIQGLKSHAIKLEKELKEAVDAKLEAEGKLANMGTDLSNANAEMAKLQAECDKLQEEIGKLKAKPKK